MHAKSLSYADAAVMTAEDAAKTLGADPSKGLSADDVAGRRTASGWNEIARNKKSAREILIRQVASPFIYLLVLAAVIAFATGEHLDAGMVVLFMAINTALGFFQEYRAEKATDVLMQYWQDTTHAFRGGKVAIVKARELVPGDVVRLQAGDKIPADVRFLSTEGVTVDESVLTGESLNVTKDASPLATAPRDYFEATNIGFYGTALLTGEAVAVVIATGKSAALGDIATLTAATKTVSAFEKQITSFSTFIMKLVVVTLAFVFALNLGIKGLGHLEELILFSIALTVGVIPEALPVVSTIAMSRGAQRMAQRKVIVKRLSAIDDLGSIDILCTDKTGTVTQNQLHVADVHAKDQDACLRYALLGSSFLGERAKQPNNAFDVAVWRHVDANVRKSCAKTKKLGELPFDPVRRRNSVLVDDGGARILIVRGSADEVLPRCSDVPDPLALGKYLASQGLAGNRTIVIAARRGMPADAPTEDDERDLEFVGVIAFHDPLKRDAVAAVRRAASLGVQIKILTGDSKEVAGAVALKLRLVNDPLEVMTGAAFDALEPGAQVRAVHDYHVFARVNPRQKFAILALLQQKNVVGFLGEGFNDAPGLKMANVGLAVEGASDIAKEAADVILLNRNLSVIFDGIEEGRRTFANTTKYLKITLASNFGNFYAVAVASFFIDFLPMLPVQILLLNLLSDVPMITIAADSVDASELRKPTHYDARHIVLYASVLGFVSSIFDFTTFAVFQRYGAGTLQAVWFTVSTLTEISLVYSLRTTQFFLKGARPPLSIVALSAAAAVLAFAIPLSPLGSRLFGFSRPTAQHMAIGLAIVATYFVTTETVKLLLAKHANGALNGK